MVGRAVNLTEPVRVVLAIRTSIGVHAARYIAGRARVGQ
jgi:hypothetical protein